MIKIKIEISEDNVIKSLSAEGHSDCSVKGSDIICASVSTLIYTLHLSLVSLDGSEVDFKDDNKNIFFKVNYLNSGNIAEARGITIFFIKGLMLLERDFGSYLKIQLKKK